MAGVQRRGEQEERERGRGQVPWGLTGYGGEILLVLSQSASHYNSVSQTIYGEGLVVFLIPNLLWTPLSVRYKIHVFCPFLGWIFCVSGAEFDTFFIDFWIPALY